VRGQLHAPEYVNSDGVFTVRIVTTKVGTKYCKVISMNMTGFCAG
jgi:hypothetical protein